jgi:hypothetical protein
MFNYLDLWFGEIWNYMQVFDLDLPAHRNSSNSHFSMQIQLLISAFMSL